MECRCAVLILVVGAAGVTGACSASGSTRADADGAAVDQDGFFVDGVRVSVETSTFPSGQKGPNCGSGFSLSFHWDQGGFYFPFIEDKLGESTVQTFTCGEFSDSETFMLQVDSEPRKSGAANACRGTIEFSQNVRCSPLDSPVTISVAAFSVLVGDDAMTLVEISGEFELSRSADIGPGPPCQP